MHKYSHDWDFFFFLSKSFIRFLHLNRTRKGLYGYIEFLNLYFTIINATILFSRKKNNSVLYNDLCIKAVIDMEDKCLFNLDKFHLLA